MTDRVASSSWVAVGEAEILSNLSASKDGKKFAFVGHSRSHPPEVIFDVSDRLTNSNPWLKDMKFAKQEVVKYKARDGLDIEGILIHGAQGIRTLTVIASPACDRSAA